MAGTRVHCTLDARCSSVRIWAVPSKVSAMKHDIEHRTLPASLYRDAESYSQERRRIFARSWHFIGHESQFGERGAYIATEIAGFPLLAVRGEDSVIRVFHNVCRHRAGPL